MRCITLGLVLALAGCSGSDEPLQLDQLVVEDLAPVMPSFATSALALDATHVYWIDGSVRRLSKAGGEVEIVGRSEPATELSGITVDAERVYWGSWREGTLHSAPLGGGDSVLLASGPPLPWNLVVDDTHLYWVTGNTEDATIWRVSLDGGAPEELASVRSEDLRGLAVDDTRVYWTTWDEIFAMEKTGGAPVAIMTAESPHGLVVDGERICWTAGEGVHCASLAGGPSTALAETPAGDAIAIDGSNVFWTTGLGEVVAASLDGDGPHVIATEQDDPRGIAADDSGVYWITETSLRRATE